jgi:hypothetical protein
MPCLVGSNRGPQFPQRRNKPSTPPESPLSVVTRRISAPPASKESAYLDGDHMLEVHIDTRLTNVARRYGHQSEASHSSGRYTSLVPHIELASDNTITEWLESDGKYEKYMLAHLTGLEAGLWSPSA